MTVAVWVGYDNADGKRRTLGRGQTGGKVAMPIFEPIIQAAWHHHAPKTALAPPSPEAQRQLVAVPINLPTGDRLPEGSRGGFLEYFRLDRYGQIDDTQYRLVPHEQAYAYRGGEVAGDGEMFGGWWRENDNRPFTRFPIGATLRGRKRHRAARSAAAALVDTATSAGSAPRSIRTISGATGTPFMKPRMHG